MTIALVRPPTAALARCELTYLAREPIDVSLALAQHAAYVQALQVCGARVISLPPAPDLPDAPFVEDTAVVLDEVAVLTIPGAASRRPEVPAVAAALAPYRPLLRLTPPATLDGGDVVRVGRTLYVGAGGRSNAEGIRQLAALLDPYGYTVRAVAVTGCLHLKTACTTLDGYLGSFLLVNPDWLDTSPFAGAGLDLLPIAPEEPFAADTLTLAGVTFLPADCPRTRELLAARGLTVQPLDVSEFQKAEASVTCLSLILGD
jgi:dimethylargininase